MAKKVKTISGDTFDLLALLYYGNEKMASAIMEANPQYCDILIFDAGVFLVIPDRANTVPPETLPPWRRYA